MNARISHEAALMYRVCYFFFLIFGILGVLLIYVICYHYPDLTICADILPFVSGALSTVLVENYFIHSRRNVTVVDKSE